MVSKTFRIDEILEVGPCHITVTGGGAAVYLGRKLKHLIGKKVIVTLKVIAENNNQQH